MFMKARLNCCPHWGKYHINSLPAGLFRCGNKIAVTRYQNNLLHLFFQSKRSDINTDTHVNTLLLHTKTKVLLCKIF